MKKLILPVAVLTVIAFSSCGGGPKVPETICECLELKDKYDSKEAAEKELGADKFKEIDEACEKLAKEATPEDREKCK